MGFEQHPGGLPAAPPMGFEQHPGGLPAAPLMDFERTLTQTQSHR